MRTVRFKVNVLVNVLCLPLLLFFAVRAEEWRSFMEANGMPCQEVSALASDGEILWVGTFGKFRTGGDEIVSYNMEKDEWTRYSPEKVQCGTVFSICVEENNVWFGTDSGFVCYSKPTEEWNIFPPEIGLPGQQVRTVVSSGNTLWMATYRKEGYETIGCGLTRFDKSEKSCTTFTEKDGLPSNTIRFIDVRDGLLWIGTENGFINYNPIHEQFALYFPGGSIHEDIRCMAFDGDTYWFGTDGVVLSYSTSKETWVEYEGGPDFVSHMLLTNKRLWVAPLMGLVAYNFEKQEWQEHQVRFLSETALSGLNVKALCATTDYLWVGTADGGLSRYTFDTEEQSLTETKEKREKVYPQLTRGYETPKTVIQTLVRTVQESDVNGMLGCFTVETQDLLKKAAAERGKTPLDMFRRWFEGIHADDIPEDLIKDIHRDLRSVLVENIWLLDKKPERMRNEDVQDVE